MQSLESPYLFFFTFPKPLNPPSTSSFHPRYRPPPPPLRLHRHHPPLKCFASDEFPVDETLPENFVHRNKETEDEARRRNWIDRGWAPWEEILTPEANFARKSLNEGEEVPLKTPEAIEAFNMLSPSYRKKKMEELGMDEDEFSEKQFEIKGEIPEPIETLWAGPMVVRLVPPRDWPPRGWEVDREELAFMREAHKMLARRVSLEQLEGGVIVDEDYDTGGLALDRYKVFLKQYEEWVEANRDRLEEESYLHDQDYHPGRRKRGKDYKEGMYELPFYYPGQICEGMVTTLHLYQGAFVDIGGVYEGWVPIKNNDWYWIRHHIKVGMHVMVEVLAKRDPYRFRFPIELRFVHPNIDHLIFNRFEYPPIFQRNDTNPDEIRRDCGRPPIPRKDPGDKPEEEPLLSDHPYVDKLWQINAAEQMILTDMEVNPDKYKGKKLSELTDEDDFDEQNSVQHTEVKYKNTILPKTILKVSVKELDLEAAFAERQHHNKQFAEAKARGEEYEISKLRRHIEMDEYDAMHWRRSFEEREALLRDVSCRKALGLPLEEPGRYVDASHFGKDQFDPENPLYRYDYWGEPKNSEKSRLERIADQHNKSIVGKGTVWYEMSYEDCIKQQEVRKAQAKREREEERRNADNKQDQGSNEDEDSDSDDDFDFSLLRNVDGNLSEQIHVNGTESFKMSDEGMFEE